MSGQTELRGGLELARAVDSIFVGRRHRKDYGDIDDLVRSIGHVGLLQPITITPDGVLVCGARRLEAIKRLGWTTVNVWVRSGISDRLGQLLAEQDENTLHKPLTKVEAAALYRELKTLMTEDAARRRAYTQFQPGHAAGEHGPANFAEPSTARGEARAQAAAMIPGGMSHATYEKINVLRDIAESPDQPEPLRAQAAADVDKLEAGAAVDPLFQRARAATQIGHDDGLLRLGAEAVQRAKAAKKQRHTARPSDESAIVPMRFPTRAFLQTWGELSGWWTHYDADALATELTEEQVEAFLATVDGTARFAERLRAARTSGADDLAETDHRQLRAL
ncbi:MAG TPA: ParB N-terminal domain-containing protein [Microbacterium sp.]|nr:ParB N-terminal domain-containing protein [Microbacterium sp.]